MHKIFHIFTDVGRFVGGLHDFHIFLCVMPYVSKLSSLDASIPLPLRKFVVDNPAAFFEQFLVDNSNRFDIKKSNNVENYF